MANDEQTPPTPSGGSSRTRDHLANERTFLAWVRTALGLIGLGFVLARMGLFLRQLAAAAAPEHMHGFHTGSEFVISGVLFLLFGTGLCAWSGWLYRRARLAIDADRYEPARGVVIVLTAVVVASSLLIVGLVLWRTLGSEGM